MSTDNRPVPTTPCPTCRRVASIEPNQIGTILRCPECKTRYRPALAPVTENSAETPADSSAPRPREGNVYEEGYGRYDETALPRSVIALAIMDFVYAGLLLICGVLTPVLLKISPNTMPGPTIEPKRFVLVYVVQGLTVASSAVLLYAGLTVLRRSRRAQTWSMVALGLAGLLLVLNLGEIALNFPLLTGRSGETMGLFTGIAAQLIFWLGYIIPGAILSGSAFRTPTDPTP